MEQFIIDRICTVVQSIGVSMDKFEFKIKNALKALEGLYQGRGLLTSPLFL